MVDLEQGPCVIKRLRGCGAGYEYVAVTPEGDIYPCHQFVGQEQFRQGSVLDDTMDLDLAKTFSGLNIYTREQCRDCWAKFYCSGWLQRGQLSDERGTEKAIRTGVAAWNANGWSAPFISRRPRRWSGRNRTSRRCNHKLRRSRIVFFIGCPEKGESK